MKIMFRLLYWGFFSYTKILATALTGTVRVRQFIPLISGRGKSSAKQMPDLA